MLSCRAELAKLLEDLIKPPGMHRILPEALILPYLCAHWNHGALAHHGSTGLTPQTRPPCTRALGDPGSRSGSRAS
jgi:hypothetical protein